MLNLRFEGTARLRAALQPSKTVSALVRALGRAGARVERRAKQNVTGGNPLYVRTSRLKSSIQTVVDHTRLLARVGTNVIYGPVHEFGAMIVPKVARALHFPVSARGQRVNPATWKGAWATVQKVEIPERPWLRPAYKDSRDEIIEDFRQALERNLKP